MTELAVVPKGKNIIPIPDEIREAGFDLSHIVPTEINGKTWFIPFKEYGVSKVIDWNSPIWDYNPSEGTAILHAVNPTKFTSTYLNPFNDKGIVTKKKNMPGTGIRIGWMTGKYDPTTQEPVFGGIKISKLTTVLNLADLNQRKQYVFITLNPIVLGSRNCWFPVNATLKIHDKGIAAKKNREMRKLKREAYQYIDEAADTQILSLARVLRTYNEDDTLEMVRDNLEAYAESNPEEFMELVNSKDREYLIAYREGLQLGVIEHNVNKGYMFGGVPIGHTEPEALEYIRRTPEVFRGISYQLEQERLRSVGKQAEEADYQEVSGEESPEVLELRRQLREEQQRTKALEEAMATGQGKAQGVHDSDEETIDNPGMMEFEEEKPDLEPLGMPALKQYIKDQGYPYDEWKMIRSKDGLREYIQKQWDKGPDLEEEI